MTEMSAQPGSRRSDRELVDAVLERQDERAFRELYSRHTPRLFALVARLLARGDDEAEDVVQETWIHAFESLESFRWGSSFSTWLSGIGLNRVRDRIRRYGRSRETASDRIPDLAIVPGPHGANPPAVHEAREARDVHETRIDLERMIARLPDDQRLVLVLHDVEGLKHREISEQLGIPEGTSKTLLSNARKRLRAMMSKKGAQA